MSPSSATAAASSCPFLTGFPCQPFSAAGAQLAESDPRYLWPAVRTAIAHLRPPRVLLENVRNLVGMRKGEVWRTILDDLANLGYDVTWLTLGACAVGAAHHRHRVFALATQGATPLPAKRLDVQECGARRGANGGPVAAYLGMLAVGMGDWAAAYTHLNDALAGARGA